MGFWPPSLVDWPPDADLRVPLPERAHLRGFPADERPAGDELRGVRREPRPEGPVPGGGAFQGIRLLRDGLRPRLAQGREGGRVGVGLDGWRREEGDARGCRRVEDELRREAEALRRVALTGGGHRSRSLARTARHAQAAAGRSDR